MKKIKIKIGYDKLTPEDVERNKNFDNLYSSYTKSNMPLYKKPIFLGSIVVVLAIAAFLLKETIQEKEVSNLMPTEAAFINPPLTGVEVEYSKYEIKAAESTEFIYATGSKINIPANAFLDKNGKEVSGKIEIRYREFHDPLDFFVSGIPMTYDSAGTKYTFESAGMLDILGFQKGEPIYLKPGKTIQIQMISQQEDSNYNLYALDTVKKNWTYKGKDEVIVNKPSDSRTSVAIDTLPQLQKITKELASIENEIKALPKPLKPVKAREERYQFNIEVDAKEFPELFLYKESLFEIGEENKDFDPKFADILWDDAVLGKNKKNNSYMLTLKKGKKSRTFIVYPVVGVKDYNGAMKEYEKKYKQYEIALEERRAEEKQKQEEKERLLLKWENERAAIQKRWQEEQDRTQANIKLDNTTDSLTRKSVLRVLYINNFGVWNCDRPVPRVPQGAALVASYADPQHNSLSIDNICLVEKGRNAIFNYSPYHGSRFYFNPQVKNMAWAVTKDNKLAVYTTEDFEKINKVEGDHTFVMTITDKKFENVLELRKYLDL